MLAGIDRKTVRKALKRLVASGLLEKLEGSKNGNHYRFTQNASTYLQVEYDGVHETDILSFLGHDAFRRGALNASGVLIHYRLSKLEQATLATLAKRSGRSVGTVKSVLDKFLAVGLAEKEGNIWRALPYDMEKLDLIAKDFGTNGKRKAKREKIAKERSHRAAFFLSKTPVNLLIYHARYSLDTPHKPGHQTRKPKRKKSPAMLED